jgi:glycosidase
MVQHPHPRRSYRHDVFYEVNIRQYTQEGTLAAFSKHLPRLADMGVTILWLMPHYPIGVKNRKGSAGSYYSIRDYRAVNSDFGTMEDFKELVRYSHSLGMKVIIDWVANHAAWDNVWTITHPNYFLREESGEFVSPYDWSDVIQFDHHNVDAHQALRDAMAFWIQETDIDGFRADLAHLTPLSFWLEARKQMDQIKPDLIWLAETEDAAYYGAFDLEYAWKWMHKTESFVKNHLPLQSFFDVLQDQEQSYLPDDNQLYFTSNHDENSWNGTEFEKYGVYAEALAVFSFLYPRAVPLIYSGQEIPNRRRLAFFKKDPLEWPATFTHQRFYQKLANLRKRINADFSFDFLPPTGRLMGFRLWDQTVEVLVWLNLDTIPHPIDYQLDSEFVYIDWMDSNAEIDWGQSLQPGEYRIVIGG